jgi:hypothetical protein
MKGFLQENVEQASGIAESNTLANATDHEGSDKAQSPEIRTPVKRQPPKLAIRHHTPEQTPVA